MDKQKVTVELVKIAKEIMGAGRTERFYGGNTASFTFYSMAQRLDIPDEVNLMIKRASTEAKKAKNALERAGLQIIRYMTPRMIAERSRDITFNWSWIVQQDGVEDFENMLALAKFKKLHLGKKLHISK